MKPKFKVGQWLFYCGRNAKILEVNADGTYFIEYWMKMVGEGAKYLCYKAEESSLTQTRFKVY